jgi:glycosyltransferase involved in cell wall biosynthesis
VEIQSTRMTGNRSSFTEANGNLHVLNVVPTLEVGGMELAMSRVIGGLVKRGMRHSVVCLRGNPVIGDHFDSTVSVFCMHSRPKDPVLPFRLLRMICRLRPDIIHARNWSAWPDVAAARLAFLHPPPIILSFHGFTSVQRISFKRRLGFRALGQLATTTFTVSEASRVMLSKLMGLSSHQIGVIPNGVDTERFSPPNRSKDSVGRLIVGSVGNLTAVKNQAMLLRAFSILISRGADLELRIAGEGPERPALTELAISLGIGDRFQLAGRLSVVEDFLRSLDIFVLCSDSEAHPNSLLEAMATGLPCIGTSVGGIPSVLDEGKFGLIIEPGNVDSLSKALERLIKDRNFRRNLGDSARSHVISNFDMTSMIDAYENLYCKVSRR